MFTMMAVRKLSVSLEENAYRLAKEQAEAEGLTLSTWLSRVAEHEAKIQAGLREVELWEAEHGAFTEEELRRADVTLHRLGIV